jgi:hypothetical protein
MLALLATTPVRANTFTNADAQRFSDLVEKANTLGHDMGSVAKSAEATAVTMGCVLNLLQINSDFRHEMRAFDMLVRLDSSMVSPDDEASVMDHLRFQVTLFFTGLDNARSFINDIKGHCESNGAIVAKARDLSHMYDEATSLIQAIGGQVYR